MSAIARVFRPAALRRLPQLRRAGHGHETPSWNEPGGYLFNEKPVAHGLRRKKEDWESLWLWGMGGGFVFIGLQLYYKPDTSVTTWATKEAEKSLKEKGVSLDF
ncbi:hypothetical protein BZG36_01015 [Bifiguratus adelaidae]|uniref:NADH dehydrogenase [ubiquinone] 1 beta subcomplex subunit 11, mitochondrial n=1 Tax=Bifiguratus adelaidae TaxID=1938954 RepID=A0A261Y638_9FUNG|nr:hypothetical protein BZG36_01015 [Bifiguratus adelaidae]